MLKHEFEQLAIRNNRSISGMLYDTIEMFYMSDSNYHREHGGIEESKQDFVKRIFGKEFFVSEFYSDRAWGIENSRVTGPDGRVFIRHFNDCNEMIAFIAAEIR